MKQQRLFTVVETGENNIDRIRNQNQNKLVRYCYHCCSTLLTSCNSIDGCSTTLFTGCSTTLFTGCSTTLFTGCSTTLFTGCSTTLFTGCSTTLFTGCSITLFTVGSTTLFTGYSTTLLTPVDNLQHVVRFYAFVRSFKITR